MFGYTQIIIYMNFRRLLCMLGIIAVLSACKEPVQRPLVRLVPLPAEITDLKGTFTMSADTKIGIRGDNQKMRQLASFITVHTEKYFGFTGEISALETSEEGSVFLNLHEDAKLGNESYQLTVDEDGVVIEAATASGLFYGIQTLLQLMPSVPQHSPEIVLPAIDIKDSPRMSWRGMHLDVSRHFMPKSFILKYLDYMAMHKFNTFHWHLADDQGWRIQINKYPRLTGIGAVRQQTLTGHANNPTGMDTIPYGGYYTQSDVREIVAYAADRYITIVPGIEMPGHALAALAAYPEIGCTGGPYKVASRWGLFSDVYCPGKEETYDVIKGVLSEISELFPGSLIHIGGAACYENRWEKCPACQHRVKNDSLNTTHQLHKYFVRRVNSMIDSLGKKMSGWDEIMQDTLLTKGVVHAWHDIGQATVLAQRNVKTVMSPAKFCNFDMYQANPGGEPLATGGMLTLEQVYNFEPVPADLSQQEANNIIGAQANVWTQYMKSPEYVEYMIFPRAAALAEVVWSPVKSRNYVWFKKRMLEQIKRYDAEGIRYCKTEFKAAVK